MTTSPTTQSVPSLQLLSESELVRVLLADDYEILEELGRGGMAVVFRAREKALDREVAIKVLPARLVVDPTFVDRFEHEARIAAKLEHPNIVPIYRVGRAGPNGEVIYFVMKLLRGQSLSAVLRERGKLESGDVRRILMETASALGYAAKRSVVHRDIKPDNIMLDSEGRCVVTDFGIAKAPGGQQTTAGLSLGTPRYMSPEHAMGSPLDGRSDMYSLGIVAYQCLFGKPPYEAEDPFATLYKHINEPLPQPTLASDDEWQLYAVIARMLAKKPGDRFQDANELIAALGGEVSAPTLVPAVRTSMGMLAPTEMIPTPLPWYRRRWTKRSRLELTLWAVGIMSALGGTFWLGQQMQQAEAIVPPAATSQRPAGSKKTSESTKPVAVPAAAPSTRAALIIADNKLQSSCLTRDTLPTSKPLDYMVILDPLRDRKAADKMTFTYDVCGLRKGTAFNADFVLTKKGGIPGFRQKPVVARAIETAKSTRSRMTWTLNTSELSAGDYELEVIITDNSHREIGAKRPFRIVEK